MQWVERLYHVSYLDGDKYIESSNAASGLQDLISKRTWAGDDAVVTLADPDLAKTNHASGYKFMGWALTEADAATGTNLLTGTSAIFNVLFKQQNPGIADENELAKFDYEHPTNNSGLKLYASWKLYVPYVVEYYTVDGNGNETVVKDKDGNPVTTEYDETDKKAWEGGSATASDDEIESNRPAGYLRPTTNPSKDGLQSGADDVNNIVKVVYSQIQGFKLNFDQNLRNATQDDFMKTYDDLTWGSKPYDRASADTEIVPTQQGFKLRDDMVTRWNTKRDGSGMGWNPNGDNSTLDFDNIGFGALYNSIPESEREANIVTLFAQWKELVAEIVYITDGNGTVNRSYDKISVITGKPVGAADPNALTSTAKANPGYHFVRWMLQKADGTGASYKLGEAGYEIRSRT